MSSADRAAGIFMVCSEGAIIRAAQGVRKARNSIKPDNLGSQTTDWCECVCIRTCICLCVYVGLRGS